MIKMLNKFVLLALISLVFVILEVECVVGEAIPSTNNLPICNDRPLMDFQASLLDVAMDTASNIPVKPHIKDRSRAQELVVEACLKLGQPLKAEQYTKRIDDWRKGICYARLALYGIQNGCTQEVGRFLEIATDTAKTTNDWRRDRIRIQIAQAYALLGNQKFINELQSQVSHSEVGKILLFKTGSADATTFENHIEELLNLINSGNYDLIKNALHGCGNLFDKVYGDPIKRDRVEDVIRGGLKTMPISLRFEMLVTLSHSTIDHKDLLKANELTSEVNRLLEDYHWKPEQKVPMLGDVSLLYQGMGETQKALDTVGSALVLYDKSRNYIVDIWRARTLRPLAEAYLSMGDETKALELYRRALEEGTGNPNSRPRAEDLSATCTSMAVHSIRPDDVFWARIQQIQTELGPPW